MDPLANFTLVFVAGLITALATNTSVKFMSGSILAVAARRFSVLSF